MVDLEGNCSGNAGPEDQQQKGHQRERSIVVEIEREQVLPVGQTQDTDAIVAMTKDQREEKQEDTNVQNEGEVTSRGPDLQFCTIAGTLTIRHTTQRGESLQEAMLCILKGILVAVNREVNAAESIIVDLFIRKRIEKQKRNKCNENQTENQLPGEEQ